MKTFEIEQKYRVKSLDVYKKRLKALGAKKTLSGIEHNELFDRKGELEKKKSVLRLRRHGKDLEVLTFKGPSLKSKYSKRLELETSVSYAPMKAILNQMRYVKVFSYRKERALYELKGLHIALDKVTGLGQFIELEGSSKMISKYSKLLGLNDEMREEQTYLKMLFDKKKKNRRKK